MSLVKETQGQCGGGENEGGRRSRFRLNTMNCCLLCLKFSSDSGTSTDGKLHSFLITAVLRHLEINLKEVFSPDNPTIVPPPNSEVVAPLCDECAKLCEKASKHVRILELVRMKMDYYFDKIHGRISGANGSPRKVKQFVELMNGDSSGLDFMDAVTRTRKRILLECSKIKNRAQPKVVARRVNCGNKFTQLPPSTSDNIRSLNCNQVQAFHPHHSIKQETNDGDDSLETEIDQPAIPTSAPSATNIIMESAQVGLKLKHRSGGRNALEATNNGEKAGGERVSCNLCPKTFASIGSLYVHRHHVHSQKEFKCDICNKQLYSPQSIRQHRASAHFGIRHTCTFPGCSKSFSTKPSLRQHERDHHPNWNEGGTGRRETNTAIRNNSVRSDVRKISGGIKNLTKPTPWKGLSTSTGYQTCDFCNKIFKNGQLLYYHRRFVHLKEKEFKCEYCGKIYFNPATLRHHLNSVHLGVRYQCTAPGCLKTYTTKQSLDFHVCTIHSPGTESSTPALAQYNAKDAFILPD